MGIHTSVVGQAQEAHYKISELSFTKEKDIRKGQERRSCSTWGREGTVGTVLREGIQYSQTQNSLESAAKDWAWRAYSNNQKNTTTRCTDCMYETLKE